MSTGKRFRAVFAVRSCLLGLLVVRQAICATPSESQFDALEREYVAYVLQQFPEVATQLAGVSFVAGEGGINERLRDYSEVAVEQERETLRGYQVRFAAAVSEDLTAAQRIDRSVAMSQIAAILREDGTPRFIDRAVQVYAEEPVRAIQAQLEGMTVGGSQNGTPQEWEQVLARLQALPTYLETLQGRISTAAGTKDAPDWRLMVDSLRRVDAAQRFFLDTLPRWIALHQGSERAGLVRAVADASMQDAAAYQRLCKFLSVTFFDDPTGATAAALKPAYRSEHYAIGAENFAWMVHNNLADARSIDQLLTETKANFAKEHGAFVAAIRELASTTRNASALDRPSVGAFRQMALRLMNYTHDVRLFDVSPTDEFDVQVAPAYVFELRDERENAVSSLPSRTLYVTAGSEDPSVRNITSATVQAGFPGQAWHFQVLRQYADVLSPVRWLSIGGLDESLDLGAIGVDGWNAYAEEVLAEQRPNAAHGAYTDIEYLEVRRNALRRAAAAYIDVSLHSGRIGFDGAVSLLSEAEDAIPGSCRDIDQLSDLPKKRSCVSARDRVREIARAPTRALAASLGSSQILALRHRVENILGGEFSLQVFHLAFLMQGPVAPGFVSDELLQPIYYY